MIAIPKYSFILLVFFGIIFFIGTYYDETFQTIDYESYLLVDQPVQLKDFFVKYSSYQKDTISCGFLNQPLSPPLAFPDFCESEYQCFLTSSINKSLQSINSPLLI